MGWREDVKLGICRAGRLFLSDDNGQMGVELTATAEEINNVCDVEAVAAEHGAGLAGLVSTYRWENHGTIITQINVDIGTAYITGTAQGAAIGLDGIDGCYIGRYVLATYGNVYEIKMICAETPTQASGTFEQDVDLAYTTASDVKAGEDVDVDIIAAARDWVVGESAVNVIPKLTPDGDYLYLVGGDTAGNDAVYGAGQFVIQFLGYATF